MTARWLTLLLCLGLAGCGETEHADLKDFMEQTGKDRAAKLEPLPPVILPDRFEYNPDGLQNPFKPRQVQQTQILGGLQPDLKRPKDPLEEYPLDALRMVGVVTMRGKPHAIIRDPKGMLHRVRVGEHIGQNFGVITHIDETGIKIKEIAQDSSGTWTEMPAVLALQDETK